MTTPTLHSQLRFFRCLSTHVADRPGLPEVDVMGPHGYLKIHREYDGRALVEWAKSLKSITDIRIQDVKHTANAALASVFVHGHILGHPVVIWTRVPGEWKDIEMGQSLLLSDLENEVTRDDVSGELGG